MENEPIPDAADKEIAAAFAEFAAEPTPAPAAAEQAPAPAAAEQAPAPAAADPAPAPAAAEQAPAPAAADPAPAPAPAAADPAPAPAAEDPRIAELYAQIEALKPKPEPAVQAPLYTADEQAALTKYHEDWPDIAKAEALARRAEYHQLVDHVFKEVGKQLQQITERLDPMLEFSRDAGTRTQYQDIVARVPDYDQVRDKTLAWVETQPEWLKVAYQRVANEGTPDEVAGLIARFKQETSYAAPSAAPAVPAAPAPATPAISPAAKAAAAKLTVVKTGRSEAGTAAEETFENAFSAYAAEEDKRLSKRN